jgi:hypothetical protein
MPVYAEFFSVSENETERAVLLSGDSIALMFSVLGEYAEHTYNWQGSGEFSDLTDDETDVVKALIAKAERELMSEVIVAKLPYFAHLFHYENHATVGNAIVPGVNASQFCNHYSWQNAPAQNDEWISPLIWLEAGDYELKMHVVKNNQSGIFRLEWNGDMLDEIDLYSSSVVYNQLLSFEVSSDGEAANQIHGFTNSKNASSSGYRLMITDMWLTPVSWVG